MSKTIVAGKYRHRITIKNAAADTSRDAYGRRLGAGSTVATVWASKEDWAGDERAENGREYASVMTRWRTRYNASIAPEMTITHGADVYQILSVLDFDGMKRELTIHSRKVIE